MYLYITCYLFMKEEKNSNTEQKTDNVSPKGKEYWAKLPEFQGPLDILLHFVKEEELNIYDIPITGIIKDFLGYIEYMQSMDIEVAGEFLLMITELMKIKVRMLIPVPESGEGSDEEDPRMTLIKKLLEYKRFKEVADEISKLEDETKKRFNREYFKEDAYIFSNQNDPEFLNVENLTIFNLIKGYRNVIMNMRNEVIHPIEMLKTSPEEQRDYIIKLMYEKDKIHFEEIFNDLKDKMKIVCTFVALLQLALEGFLKINVNPDQLSDFFIYKTDPIQN